MCRNAHRPGAAAAGKQGQVGSPGRTRAIARVTLREQTLEPLTPDGSARELKLLCDYREQLCSERTRLQNRLHADLVVVAPGYERHCPNLIAKRHLAAAARILRGLTGVQAELARKRLQGLHRLDREIQELEKRIETVLARTGSRLTTLTGIGPLGAARVLGEVRDVRSPRQPQRRRSEGKTYRDAIRSLKRHLSDVIYKQLRDDALAFHTIPLDG